MLHRPLSKSMVGCLLALCLVASAAAEYGYGYSSYGESYYSGSYGDYAPTYYYYPSTTSYGYGYGEPTPAYYYYAAPTPSSYGYATPAPVYYYTTPTAPATYAPPAAETYYYTVPSVPATYTPATPAYYYTVPSPAPGSYAPAEPTYYYLAPSSYGYGSYAPTYGEYPSAPTYYYAAPTAPGSYGETEPTYYYVSAAPPSYGYGSYAPALPYYYAVPASPGGYSPAAPTYYYTAPSTGGYSPSVPTYYYITPTAPGSYGPSAPTYYYYTAPSTGGYGSYAPTYYYTAPAPGTCPPCPTCSATTTAEPAKMAAFGASDMGTCYCPYDHDWQSWAIADPTCRSSLYNRCSGAGARLECAWLDEYFSMNATNGKNFVRPHEDAIQAFLYNDCPPSPPCACAGLSFSPSDDATQSFQCCKALKVHANVPFSGIGPKDVAAVCSTGFNPVVSARVSGWVAHQLWHTQCAAASSSPVYSFRPPVEEDVTEDVAVSSASGAAVPSTVFVRHQPQQQQGDNTLAAVLVGAFVGAGLAVAVAAGVIVYSSTRRGYASLV